MTDERRMFASAFHATEAGGRIPRRTDRHREQQLPADFNSGAAAGDPLRDLQQLLTRLIADGDDRRAAAASGDWGHFDGAFQRPHHRVQHPHHEQQHNRSHSQHQGKSNQGRFYNAEYGDTGMRDRYDRPERSALLERQYSYAAAAATDGDDGAGPGDTNRHGRADSYGNYDHWFTEKLQGSKGQSSKVKDPWVQKDRSSKGTDADWGHARRRSDNDGCEGTQIPVIDRRREGGRVPPSPSWPLTCMIQQSQFTTRPTETYQEPEQLRHQPGWGCRTLDWKQERPMISSRREATLRASAEQLDSLAAGGASVDNPTATTVWHRRSVSAAGGGGGCEDYEAIPGSQMDGDDNSGASAASATMAAWYRPAISREQAVAALRDAPPGSFLVRDSQTYPGAFGLAVRVATRPPPPPSPTRGGIPAQPLFPDPRAELVRHYLVESCRGGVRLRGCANEPVFGGLAELVQCHTQVTLALPCRLRLPAVPAAATAPTVIRDTERRGNIFRVLYFCTVDAAASGGTQQSSGGWAADVVTAAVSHTVQAAAAAGHRGLRPIECRMRVSDRGVKLSGSGWHRDFRLAYAARDCAVCRLDSAGRRFPDSTLRIESRLFGLVVKKYGLYGNQTACLVLGDLEATQPAPAMAAFVNRCIGAAGGSWR